MAHAPNPTVVISRSVVPSRRLLGVMAFPLLWASAPHHAVGRVVVAVVSYWPTARADGYRLAMKLQKGSLNLHWFSGMSNQARCSAHSVATTGSQVSRRLEVARAVGLDMLSQRSTTVSRKFHTMNAYASYSLALPGSSGGREERRYGRSSPILRSSK